MTRPLKLGAVRTTRSFVAHRSNYVQSGWFLPQPGQIVVNFVAAVDAVVNASRTGFPACFRLDGVSRRTHSPAMNGLNPICGVSQEIIG
jgi:hypothetical protein